MSEDEIAQGNFAEKIAFAAFPNPFHDDKLNIEFTLPHDSPVHLEIFNLDGKLVAEFRDGAKANALQHYEFLPQDIAGGIVIYRLQTTAGIHYRKALMMK